MQKKLFWNSKRDGTYFKVEEKMAIIQSYIRNGKEKLLALGIGK